AGRYAQSRRNRKAHRSKSSDVSQISIMLRAGDAPGENLLFLPLAGKEKFLIRRPQRAGGKSRSLEQRQRRAPFVRQCRRFRGIGIACRGRGRLDLFLDTLQRGGEDKCDNKIRV